MVTDRFHRTGDPRIRSAIDHNQRPFAIVWNDQIVEYDMIAIPKGAKNLDLPYKYLAYAAEPEVSAQLGRYIPYGPVLYSPPLS